MKTITANGATRRISEWAKSTGIPATTLHYRLTVLSWTEEAVVNTPIRPTKFDKPLRTIAAEAGIPFGTLASRLHRGYTIEEATTKRVEQV